MSKFLQQFSALARKNYLLKLRNPKVLLFEFLIPLLMIYAMVELRGALDPQKVDKVLPTTLTPDYYATQDLSTIMNGPFRWYDCFGDSLLWICGNRVAFQDIDASTDNPCLDFDIATSTYSFDLEKGNCQRRYIAVAPSSSSKASARRATSDFMTWAGDVYGDLGDIFHEFDSEDELMEYFQKPGYSLKDNLKLFSSAIIFESDGPDWEYTLRHNRTGVHLGRRQLLPKTDVDPQDLTVRYGEQWPPSERSMRPYAHAYQEAGTITLGNVVNSFIATQVCREAGGCNSTETVTLDAVGTAAFPNDELLLEGFWGALGNLFSLLVTIALLYPLSNGVKQLVSEKESKMRQVMMIMSLRTDALFLSWALHFLALFFPLSLVLTLAAKSLFEYSDYGQIFSYFFFFFVSAMSYFGFISVFFSQPKTASIIGSMSFFVGYLLYIGVENAGISRAVAFICCLHPATAFTYGTLAFQEWEDVQIGVTQETAGRSQLYVITFSEVIGMMIFDTVYLNILTAYFGHIWPSEYGTALPWHFPFTACANGFASCWHSLSGKGPYQPLTAASTEQRAAVDTGSIELTERGQAVDEPSSYHGQEFVEEMDASYFNPQSGVSIRNLGKTFKTRIGEKTAVDGLTLDMHAGDITALLGHNGAGKSTTIAMLTGLTSPDTGTATIAGRDLITDIAKIRESLGVCPQHDVIFEDLTVEEHLDLFAALKGVPRDTRKESVNSMIASVGLTEKRHTRSRMLSGGQKRKLSLAIAFLGDSKVVFLDEPTSGMDPYSRRFTWNLIRQQKVGRVIVLTTHFMDEADLLCDRIAIMGEGRLRCCGSSLYLKRRFGVGYTVTMEKMSATRFNERKLMRLLNNVVPETRLVTNVGTEVSVQLPYGRVKDFPTLFSKLDKSMVTLGVNSYGVSVTTMEEVFLKVAEGLHGDGMGASLVGEGSPDGTSIGADLTLSGDSNDSSPGDASEMSVGIRSSRSMDSEDAKDASITTNSSSTKTETVEMHQNNRDIAPAFEKINYEHVFTMFWRHITSLLWKRWIYFHRDTKAWILQFLAPVLFLTVGVIVMVFAPFTTDQPLQEISLKLYNDDVGDESESMPTPFSAGTRFCTTPNVTADGEELCQAYTDVSGQAAVMDECSEADKMPPEAKDFDTVERMSRYLFNSREDYEASRYGAVSFEAITSDNNASSVLSGVQYIVHSNFTGVHAAPLFQSLVADAAIRSIAAAVGSDTSYTISLSVHPLPTTKREDEFTTGFSASLLASFVLLAMPYIPAAFALFVVREREIKAKYQQIVSGVSMMAYWMSTWLFDLFTYGLSATLILIILSCFDEAEPLVGKEAVGATLLLFFLFGTSVTGFTYTVSFLYNSAPGAQIGVIFIISIVGLALSILGVFLRIFPSTNDLFLGTLRYVLCVLPPFAFGDGLQAVAMRAFFSAVELGGSKTYSPWDWDCAGIDLCYLGFMTVVWQGVAITIDFMGAYGWSPRKALSDALKTAWDFCGLASALGENGWSAGGTDTTVTTAESGAGARSNEDEEAAIPGPPSEADEKDEDVRAEERRVAAGLETAGDTIVLQDVHKTYGDGKRAVRGLSLGIPNGECFGLLGINGAGKSSTIAMLTGEVIPTTGDAVLDGESIATNVHSCRRKIGFCPQFDAIFELLTGREHLTLYAKLKGVRAEDISAVVDAKIRELGLVENADRVAWSYSGGNKRKLSVAIAMIGEPEIVFLDEPSTGMDPVTRRYMWKIITDIVTRRKSCSMVLTTHSMEEAEALCTRIGVMVGGTMRCLGSTQHLRSRYGMGYQVEVGLAKPSDAVRHAKTTALLRTLQLQEAEEPVRLSSYQVARALHLLCCTAGEVDIGYKNTPPPQAVPGAERVQETLDTRHCPAFALGPRGALMNDLALWCIMEERITALLHFFDEHTPSYKLRERQAAKVRLEVPLNAPNGSKRAVADLFSLMERHRDSLFVDDYCISQTTLEQIFNSFAKLQREETGDAGGIVR